MSNGVALLLVLARLGISDESARFDGTKGLEHALNVLFAQVGMNGGDVDAVVVLGVLRELIDDGLCLWHVTGPSDFDIPSAEERTVHLVKSELSGFGRLELDEGESFVLVGSGVPGHANGSDGSERNERESHGLLFDLVEDAANVDSRGKKETIHPWS